MSESTSKLHLVAFDNYNINTIGIITSRDGKLLQRERNPVVPFNDDIINIAKGNNLNFKIDRILPKLVSPTAKAHGASIARPWRMKLPPMADMRNGDMDVTHDFELEMHNYYALLEKIKDDPTREADRFYLQSFGNIVLKNIH